VTKVNKSIYLLWKDWHSLFYYLFPLPS
jgi:hypothetical protein